jgi:pre-mRNA 3'-end-processing factor FIP1
MQITVSSNLCSPANENGGDDDDDDDDDDEDEEDSDDDVQVVIGDIKTSPTYTSLNIKRGGLLTSAVGGEKLKASLSSLSATFTYFRDCFYKNA